MEEVKLDLLLEILRFSLSRLCAGYIALYLYLKFMVVLIL